MTKIKDPFEGTKTEDPSWLNQTFREHQPEIHNWLRCAIQHYESEEDIKDTYLRISSCYSPSGMASLKTRVTEAALEATKKKFLLQRDFADACKLLLESWSGKKQDPNRTEHFRKLIAPCNDPLLALIFFAVNEMEAEALNKLPN